MLSLPWDTWLRLIVWLAIGLVVYFAYGSRNSRVQTERAAGAAPAAASR
jgi:APA family basic amino acid/polyamine antiporter